jgi:hypothetical protein
MKRLEDEQFRVHRALNNACLTVRHDFGLLPPEKQKQMREAASMWYHTVVDELDRIDREEHEKPVMVEFNAWANDIDARARACVGNAPTHRLNYIVGAYEYKIVDLMMQIRKLQGEKNAA